jgi:uncharacterized membrane protein YphA (DoxX/SURF4 family)
MKRWIDHWNGYWFPKTTTLNLSICRIIVVATQLLWFSPSIEHHIHLLEKNPEFINPQLFIRLVAAIVSREAFFTPASFTVLYWITIVAGVTSLVGFFARTSLFVFALGNWIFIAHVYSYAEIHHPEAIFCMFLMFLAFSPSGGSLSVDALIRRYRDHRAHDQEKLSQRVETAIWPLKLVHVLLALTYFSTGLAKISYGGFQWMNGYTLQNYILLDAVRRDIPIGIWMAQQHTLCILLSVFTVLFELFFFLSLIVCRTTPYFLIGGIFFHIGLYLFAGHDFFQHIILLLLLLIFLDFKLGETWVEMWSRVRLYWPSNRVQARYQLGNDTVGSDSANAANSSHRPGPWRAIQEHTDGSRR